MRWFDLCGCLCAGLCLAGCSQGPTRAEFLRREANSLRCYCTGSAAEAEAALRESERYARRCQQAGIPGILFEEVGARTYGRLYLVEKRLGREAEAEQYLQRAAECYRRSRAAASNRPWPARELRHLIEQETDRGMQVAWKRQ
jgi:hypothetical protein